MILLTSHSEDALFITMDFNQVPCCTYVPRHISDDELLRLLPSSWVTAYEQQVAVFQPQVPSELVQSTNPEYITHPSGELEIRFPPPRTRPSPFPTSFGMIQEKIPIKSFDSQGNPIFYFQDPVTGHKYFDLCDCDDCLQDSDDDFPPSRLSARRKSTQHQLQE
ncbi:uncharacterized protein LOC122084852 [Macadamia integrifolia]|uniref:uncharacterized protein LOC122084852 n=1 Tax=Macadamia integrifolia TaxID=60698 RepID=UPI001C4FAB61|nr:uncharacterized protein LOC122084852 [Macadamia integrifolia]